MRRAFASSFAAVKRKAPCSEIKLQMVSGSPVPAAAACPCPPPGRVMSNLPGEPEGPASPHGPHPTEKETGTQGSRGTWPKSHCWQVMDPSLRSKPRLRCAERPLEVCGNHSCPLDQGDGCHSQTRPACLPPPSPLSNAYIFTTAPSSGEDSRPWCWMYLHSLRTFIW